MSNNILVIICDQLSAAALKSYKNTYSDTPNLDRLAETSILFEDAYSVCPLCQPSRASFWTSRYPHQTGVLSNLKDQGFPAVSEAIPTLGDCFSKAGYRCVHFGKTHDYGSLRGFEVIESEEIKVGRTNPAINFDYETYLDIDTTRRSADFLSSAPSGPFLMVADLQNPHNICSYIGECKDGYPENFPLERPLPPLPANYEFDDIENRPPFVQYLCCAHRRQRQVSHWKKEDFRHYLYAYYYYLSMVDRQIGEILEALEKGGHKEDTMVVFLADHGEGMAAHQLVTKYGVFYEETNHVPFFFALPGRTKQKRVSGVCSLLDLAPTLLDYAGISVPGEMEGHSLLPQMAEEGPLKTGQDYVAAEWYDEFEGYTVPGRMICDGRCKYTCYMEENSEELFDLQKDPLERCNLARKPEYQEELSHYRSLLKEHTQRTDDPFFSLRTIGTESYRHHPVGRQYHEGLSAVEIYASRQRK